MLGAIIGDIVGSPYEFLEGWKSTDFRLFTYESLHTDDTLMTLAIGAALMELNGDESRALAVIGDKIRTFAKTYRLPRGAFGSGTSRWLLSDGSTPGVSDGNGSAMRVSPVGWLFDTLEDTERWAALTASPTHGHPEGIKGAQATAASIFLVRTRGDSPVSRAELREYISRRFGYELSQTIEQIRPGYEGAVSSQHTVPQAITAFLDSTSFEHALRLAVSLGGDTDTLAAIAGSIAEAAYGIPEGFEAEARRRLAPELAAIVDRFNEVRIARGTAP